MRSWPDRQIIPSISIPSPQPTVKEDKLPLKENVAGWEKTSTEEKRDKDDLIKKLEKLKEAYDKGLITKDDYEKKKQEILQQY